MKKKTGLSKIQIITGLIVIAVIAVVVWAYSTTPRNSDVSNKASVVTYENNTLREEENGKLVYEIVIGKMTLNPVTKEGTLENVTGTFYGTDGTILKIKAAKGSYNQDSKTIDLTDGLELTSNKDLTFTTKELVWDNSRRVLTAKGGVKITKPGMVATADSAESSDAFTNFKLVGNARIVKGDVVK